MNTLTTTKFDFSFVEFPSEGKKLTAYAEERVGTIYLHSLESFIFILLEALKKLVVKYPYLF